MNYSFLGVLLDETPKEVSLTFKITGCPLRCPGCQDTEYYDPNVGKELTDELYTSELLKHQGYASAVLFMGGEWYKEELIKRLKEAKKMGFKTILYTGLDKPKVSQDIINQLDYLKYGPYNEKCGSLEKSTTNQVYENLKTGEKLNKYFINKFNK